MENLPDRTIERMSQILTTEHFTLQGARSGTIAEANGRLGHYFSAVGSGVVALAFVANVSELGTIFVVFSVVLFPVLIVLGVATLVRILQIAVTDVLLAQAINRIRHYYLEAVPEAAPYLSFPHHDDQAATMRSMMPWESRFQDLASTPGPVILVNSVLSGAFASILAAGLVSAPLWLAIMIGALTLVLALGLHMGYGRRIWEQEARKHVEVRFPTPED